MAARASRARWGRWRRVPPPPSPWWSSRAAGGSSPIPRWSRPTRSIPTPPSTPPRCRSPCGPHEADAMAGTLAGRTRALASCGSARMTMRRVRLLAVLAIAAVLLVACRPGDIDASFGTNGVVTFGPNFDLGQAIVVPDGRIVVPGTLLSRTDPSHISLRRLNVNGTPDTSFGNQAVVDTFVGHGSVALVLVRHFAAGGPPHVLVQPDGKLVVGASGVRPNDPVGTAVFQLVRLTPTGTRDASFGDNGVVSTDFGFGVDRESFLRGLVLRAGG